MYIRDSLYNTLFRRGLPLAVTSFWTGRFAKEHRTHIVMRKLSSEKCALPSDFFPCILARYMQGYGMPAALFPRSRRGLPLYKYDSTNYYTRFHVSGIH